MDKEELRGVSNGIPDDFLVGKKKPCTNPSEPDHRVTSKPQCVTIAALARSNSCPSSDSTHSLPIYFEYNNNIIQDKQQILHW
jgi:hypothetical protein